ncbi:AMP-activated serine/threonine-protein kinase regulatory subunit [Blastocladiella emersonii ATCC 22665]|nr:AMP-activated serine/threonine-protein kinase regulatory subunit [Blastocladiella emersonii ATCC 22665]
MSIQPPPPAGAAASATTTSASIHTFLQRHTAYDILPLSLKVVVIDSLLPLRKAVAALVLNGLVAAPLWQSETQSFYGLLTVTDILRLILHYSEAELRDADVGDLVDEIDSMTVESLRAFRTDADAGADAAVPAPAFRVHPMHSVLEASQTMLQYHLHHVPLIDADSLTRQETIVSVLTGFKILKFLACNCPMTRTLTGTISELGIGTFWKVQTVSPAATALDAIRLLVDENVSALPVVDSAGRLLDVFTETDVLLTVRDFPAVSMWITVGEAMARRPPDFEPVHTCLRTDSVSSLFAAIQKGKISRFVVVDQDNRVEGVVSLGDLLGFVINKANV